MGAARWACVSLVLAALVAAGAGGQRLARHTATVMSPDNSVERVTQGFMLYLGAWSGCKPLYEEATESTPSLTFEPRVGVQTRDVKCQDPYENIMDLGNCLVEGRRAPSTRRSCIVSEDCLMTEWSSWRSEEDSLKPSLMRTRKIISLPQGGGTACGNTTERKMSTTRVPVTAADLFRWTPAEWGPCRLPDEPPPLPIPIPIALPLQVAGAVGNSSALGRCGGGTQRRDASCVSRLNGMFVSDHYCSGLPPPVTVQRCEVPCPRDCVVGEWSAWGPCEPLTGCPMSPVEQLTTNGYRRRNRRIVVAASEDGAPCGALSEVQPCSRPTCTRWVSGPWAACRSLEPRAPCGPGQRTRRVTCTDLQGTEVNEDQCVRAGPKPNENEPCQRACPHDCVVSGWSTWTPCSRSCATKHHRPVRTRNRTIIAPPGPEGHPCPSPEQLMQSESCNTHSCSGYSWLALPWQPCASIPAIPDIDATEKSEIDMLLNGNYTPSVNYVQYREVWCVENNDRLVKDSHCAPVKRPETSRSCKPFKSQDCVLSDWSSWSECPINAGNGATQWRTRGVLTEPIGNGAPCGPRKEKRACIPDNPSSHPRWSHGAWSSCFLPPGVMCGDGGLMTRGIWCSLHHHKIHPSVCMEDLEAEMPVSSLSCSVDCISGCQYSEWSQWTKCEHECSGDSTRSRKLLSNSGCSNTLVFEGHACPCTSVNAQLVGGWSSCIVYESETAVDRWDSGVQEKRKECGAGSRYRRLSCQDSSGHRLEPQACRAHAESLEEETALKGLVRESCWLPCPVDCRMSRWSTWGPCIGSPCGVGLQTRTRNILVNASSGGRPCGTTTQTKVCSRSCEQFTWMAGGWSECRLIPRLRSRGCGTGDQFRVVRCIEVATGGVVADSLCDPLLQPADLNACHLPCPGECVVSEWSEWSQCSQRCDSHEQRDRTRALLRGASRAFAAQRCPPLLQAQPCLLNRTCFRHTWKMTPWGDCLPLGGSPCGEGMQQREIYCERSDGRQVPTSLCDSSIRPNEPTDKFCYVDCPIDCEVTEWSSWDFSQCECGSSASDENYITRNRKIITPASTSGRPCPVELTQQVPCPMTPCYILRKSHFPRCKLDDESTNGGVCGFGVSRRNVSCIRQHDGVEVPMTRCSSQLATLKHIPAEVSCFVDCYDDCRHSPWSHWSACDTGGNRYRKRVSFKPSGPPCPQGPVFKYEVFEYANCNVTESELNRDMSEWTAYDEPTPSQDQEQDDYYIHNDDQPEKTYLLFTGRKMTDEHTTLAVGIASASLVIILMVLYLTVRCHRQRTIHKV